MLEIHKSIDPSTIVDVVWFFPKDNSSGEGGDNKTELSDSNVYKEQLTGTTWGSTPWDKSC